MKKDWQKNMQVRIQLCQNQNTGNWNIFLFIEEERGSKVIFNSLRGGFSVIPEMVEFWQGQSTRIHDRIRFRRPKDESEPDGILTHSGDNGWIYERLAP